MAGRGRWSGSSRRRDSARGAVGLPGVLSCDLSFFPNPVQAGLKRPDFDRKVQLFFEHLTNGLQCIAGSDQGLDPLNLTAQDPDEFGGLWFALLVHCGTVPFCQIIQRARLHVFCQKRVFLTYFRSIFGAISVFLSSERAFLESF